MFEFTMEGYKPVFDAAEREFQTTGAQFETFRDNGTVYGFIHNRDNPPDEEAIAIAKNINLDLFNRYMERNASKKILGYSSIPPNAHYNELDTRHIMMSVILFNLLPPVKSIVEIGGGFGNWVWLNTGIQTFDSWTIIDLPHVGTLQKWYLDQNNIQCSLVSANDYKPGGYDLVIGSHSLSEFSIEVFTHYFIQIVTHCKYFFYAHHIYGPAPELIREKKKLIEIVFDVVVGIPSENGMVMNYLLKNKFIS
jgi:hypothetical protein